MAGEITLQQLFSTPSIRKVVSEIATPDSYMQEFLGLGVGGAATETRSGRVIGWDIFNATRTISRVRGPAVGPNTVSRKPVATKFAHAIRIHEKLCILQEEIFRTRPIGGDFGTIDLRGQQYVAKQIQFLTQRAKNFREFAVSRLFRGGFGLRPQGEDLIPVERTDATAIVTIDMAIPTENTGTVEMGTGSPIISVPWDDPSADIPGQLMDMNKAQMRRSGYPIKHVLLNSSTLKYLFNNTVLGTQGGSSNIIFQEWNRGDGSSRGSKSGAHQVVFRALPWIKFHAYDGVLVVGSDSEATTVANTSLTIPDGVAIIIPEPSSDWIGYIEGSEIIAKNIMDTGNEVFGFDMWQTRVIDPTGFEIKMIDNGLPVLYIPGAVIYATVYTP